MPLERVDELGRRCICKERKPVIYSPPSERPEAVAASGDWAARRMGMWVCANALGRRCEYESLDGNPAAEAGSEVPRCYCGEPAQTHMVSADRGYRIIGTCARRMKWRGKDKVKGDGVCEFFRFLTGRRRADGTWEEV